MTDLKTLRLATIQLSPERLDAFVAYQRTLLAELARSAPGEWSGRYAFAHGHALAASKLDLVELGKLKALIGDFCGKRSTVAQLKERIAAGGDEAKVSRARQELPRLEDLTAFQERYGAEAAALLMARETELVQLHRDLAKQEGGGGHLHPR
ncbi:MAG: hypothetical protein U0228_32730 [Myxococcaceae bacterium]